MKMTALAALAVLASASPHLVRSADGESRAAPTPPKPAGVRSADFTPSTYDEAARTVELTLSVGARVRREGWDGPFNEELEISALAIDLTRVAGGLCPLLNTHARWSIGDVLGQVLETRIEVENGQSVLIAKVRFADTEAGREAEGMVARGEIKGVSIGYRVTDWKLVERKDDGEDIPTWRATSWVLLEASLVPIPADAGAGVRSEPAPEQPQTETGVRADPEEDETMRLSARQRFLRGESAVLAPNTDQGGAATPPVTQERADPVGFSGVDALAFITQARSLGIEERGNELVTQAGAGTISVETARAELLRSAAEAQAARTAPAAGGAARITEDARDKQRASIENAITHRTDSSVQLTDGGRQYRGMSLLELGRRHLEEIGVRSAGLDRFEVAERMLSRQMSTSDLPAIFGNVANRSMRLGYEGAAGSHKLWMRQTTVSDFRQIERVQLSGAPNLLQVPEGGEFKYGKLGDGKEVYALATYGRIVALTRQAIINDDLDALSRLPQLMGAAAARLETDVAYAPLTGNPTMSDGTALFHSDHGNLGTAAALGEAGLKAAEKAMGRQKGLQDEVLNLRPKYLIVGSDLSIDAQKMLTAVQSTTTSEVNVFSGRYDLVTEARLNALEGGTAPWFLAADHNQVDTVEYAYLEGHEGVYLEQRDGFNVDGIEFKVRLDVAAKAVDWRGLHKNPGSNS